MKNEQSRILWAWNVRVRKCKVCIFSFPVVTASYFNFLLNLWREGDMYTEFWLKQRFYNWFETNCFDTCRHWLWKSKILLVNNSHGLQISASTSVGSIFTPPQHCLIFISRFFDLPQLENTFWYLLLHFPHNQQPLLFIECCLRT